MQEQRHYTVKAVADLTQVKEATLRVWESRHQAVVPARTATGRRAYSHQDVERLRLLAQLVERGNAIGSVASLSDHELAARLAQANDIKRLDSLSEDGRVHAAVVDAVKAAVRRFDLATVVQSMQDARFRFGARAFALGIVAPLMAGIGAMVVAGELSIAQEHSLSAIVKAHLLSLLFSGGRSTSDLRRPRIALATMEGDLHEIGLLISGVLCAHYGIEVLYFGPNMPPEPLAKALKAMRSSVLILGLTPLPKNLERWNVNDFVTKLVAKLPEDHEVWLGGIPSGPLDLQQIKHPWRYLNSFEGLDRALMEVQ